jgi:hypothetical protein
MEQLTPLHGKVALALVAAVSAAAWAALVEPRERGPVCRELSVADVGVQPGFGDLSQRAVPDCVRVELPAAGN